MYVIKVKNKELYFSGKRSSNHGWLLSNESIAIDTKEELQYIINSQNTFTDEFHSKMIKKEDLEIVEVELKIKEL